MFFITLIPFAILLSVTAKVNVKVNSKVIGGCNTKTHVDVSYRGHQLSGDNPVHVTSLHQCIDICKNHKDDDETCGGVNLKDGECELLDSGMPDDEAVAATEIEEAPGTIHVKVAVCVSEESPPEEPVAEPEPEPEAPPEGKHPNRRIKLNPCTALVYENTLYKGGKPLQGIKKPRSAQSIGQCADGCMQFGRKWKQGRPCMGVNYHKPNCYYLTAGLAEPSDTNFVDTTEFTHAYIQCP